MGPDTQSAVHIGEHRESSMTGSVVGVKFKIGALFVELFTMVITMVASKVVGTVLGYMSVVK